MNESERRNQKRRAQQTRLCCSSTDNQKHDESCAHHPNQRLPKIEAELRALSSELWDIVQPTRREIEAQRESFSEMSQDDLVDMLVTDNKNAWGIAINTCQDVLDYREELRHERESGEIVQ